MVPRQATHECDWSLEAIRATQNEFTTAPVLLRRLQREWWVMSWLLTSLLEKWCLSCITQWCSLNDENPTWQKHPKSLKVPRSRPWWMYLCWNPCCSGFWRKSLSWWRKWSQGSNGPCVPGPRRVVSSSFDWWPRLGWWFVLVACAEGRRGEGSLGWEMLGVSWIFLKDLEGLEMAGK